MTDRTDGAADPRAARLRARLADVEARLAAQRRTVEGIVESARDSNADDEHDPEGATLAWERQQAAALRGARPERERDQLLGPRWGPRGRRDLRRVRGVRPAHPRRAAGGAARRHPLRRARGLTADRHDLPARDPSRHPRP